MKSLLFTIILLFISTFGYSQLSKGGSPYSLQASIRNNTTIKSALSDSIIVKEPLLDIIVDEKNTPFLFAKSVTFNLNLKSKAPIALNDGKLWIWRFYAKNAKTLNTYFSKFSLMEGAKLFVYRSDGRQILGAFTSENNQDHNSLSVGYVESNDIIIEYFEPNNTNTNKSEIELGVIGYGFREGFNRFNELKVNESGSCNININCPAGTNYQDIKRSVARILYQKTDNNWYLCSGSVVNNTLQNGNPYFLTAFHCYDQSNLNSYIFYFNYESPNCNNPSTSPSSNTLSGSTFKAAYSGSDFALVQINNSIPQSYNVFYAGWDNTDVIPTSTVSIHHPSGDIKKIAIDNNSPVKQSITIGGQSSSTWRVSWDSGITEGGSSGSMLISSSTKNIIGQLFGGGSSCSAPSASDYYGRLAVSWTGGGSSSTRLRDWLDPNNTNATTLTGIFYGTIACTVSNTTFCQGQNISVNYTATGTYTSGNVFTVQLSNSSGSFISPVNIGSINSTALSGSINATIPTSTSSGTGYRVRIIASTPSITGTDNSNNLTVNPLPAQPSTFTASSATVCQGQSNVTYTIPAVAGATSYSWAYSGAGETINGTGASVTISFSNTATSGTLSVIANNACGGGTARTLAITVNPLPAQPSTFTASSATVCQGQSNVTYTIPAVAGATSYSWTYSGAGETINGTGASVTISFSNTATSGTLSVIANNACGGGIARTLAITVNPLPAQPSTFTASTATVCQGQSNITYTIPAVAGATSYSWAYSGAGETINGTGASVTISFSNTATSGTLSVIANNACGGGTARTLAITVNPLPAQPSTFTASSATVCQGQSNVTYTIPAVAGATSYSWAYSGAGETINGTGASVTISFSNTATSGTLSVIANNACGGGTARTYPITVNPLLPQPSNFTASTATVCQGASNITYTVPTVAGATSYTWTYSGTGVPTTGTSNSITLNFSSTATSGVLSVVANNACGPSTARTLSITVNSIPPIPDNFTAATATVCQGQNDVTYTVPAVAGATSYSWSYSGAGVPPITGTGRTITISFSNTATSGTLSVYAVNACGNGSPRTYPITVRQRPTASLTGTQTIVSGQSVSLTATLTGESPWTITVNDQNYNVTTSTYQFSVMPTTTTTYTLSSVSNVCATVPVTTNNSAIVTVSSQSITTSITGTTFCAGTTITGTYSTTGSFNVGNVFTAQLSNATGSFTSPIGLGTVSGGNISVTVPANTPSGTGYRIRVVSSNPSVNGTENSSNLTINVPATATMSGTQTINSGQTANLTVNLTGTSPWSIVVSGNTTNNITTNPFTYQVSPPVGVTSYTLTSVSNVCGTTTVSVSNTATVTVNQQTITTSITGTTFCAGTTVTGTYSTTGSFNVGNVFTAQLSNATGSFTSPISLGTVSGGNISATIPANTPAGTGYRIRVVSSNPSVNGAENSSNLTVSVPATATMSGTQTINSGQTANLTVNLTGTSPWSIVVSGNTTGGITTSPFTYQVSPAVGVTAYTLTSISNVCGTTTVSANNSATVTVNPPVACDNDFTPRLVSNTNAICPNESAVLQVLDAPFGYNYSWSLNNGTFANQSNPVLIANQAGTYQAQLTPSWYQVEPEPSYKHLNEILFVNDYSGWIIGDGGTLLHSEDGGNEWTKIYVDGGDLNDIHITSQNDFWIVSDGGKVFKSNTGGVSWEQTPIFYDAHSISFGNKDKGAIVGYAGNILRTINNGQNWQSVSSGTTNTLTKVHFITENNVIAIGDNGTILRSVDAGNTWLTIASNTSALLVSISFINSLEGWVLGYNFSGTNSGTVILRTQNGGLSWTTISTRPNEYWNDLKFKDSMNGWAVSNSGAFLKTIDGGSSWNIIGTLYQNLYVSGLNSIFFSSDYQTVHMVGHEGGIVKSANGGINWNLVNPPQKTISDVEFLDNNKIIAVGDRGFVWRSSNKGTSWIKTFPTGISNADLSAIDFVDINNGWASGLYGEVFMTSDGGITWSKQKNRISTEYLYDIVFLNTTKGFAIGSNGFFIETINGGVSWTQRNIGTIENLNSVTFVDATTGWIVGGNGLILKTTDGGITWQSQISNEQAVLSDVFFVNSQVGWAYGGTTLKTTNGGSTWFKIPNTPNNYALYFKNENEGWIATGGIWHTTDGGNNWQLQANPPLGFIGKITFNSANVGIVISENAIFRLNPNACTVNTNSITIQNVIATNNVLLSGTNTVSPYTSKSANTIQSSEALRNGQTIEYRAGSSITLNPGFNTANQANFKAEIRGCNN